MARVFREDQIDCFQNLDGAERNVAEVSDRGADEKKAPCYAACSLNFISSCCFGTAPMT